MIGRRIWASGVGVALAVVTFSNTAAPADAETFCHRAGYVSTTIHQWQQAYTYFGVSSSAVSGGFVQNVNNTVAQCDCMTVITSNFGGTGRYVSGELVANYTVTVDAYNNLLYTC
jgi:hypothetical protein